MPDTLRAPSLTLSLPDRLQQEAKRILGASTPHVQQGTALLAQGVDPELIVAAWRVMLEQRPAAAAYFAKDFATRWRPKVRSASVHTSAIEPAKHKCPGCHSLLHVEPDLLTCFSCRRWFTIEGGQLVEKYVQPIDPAAFVPPWRHVGVHALSSVQGTQTADNGAGE
jgi:hypothetical protein